MQFDPRFIAEEARAFCTLSEELKGAVSRLNSCLHPMAGSRLEVAKEVVTYTRALDGALERLAQTPRVNSAPFDDARAQLKVSVRNMLQLIKQVNTGEVAVTPAVEGEMQGEAQLLNTALDACERVLEAPRAAPAPSKVDPKGAGTLRWEQLQRKAAEKEVARAPVVTSSDPKKAAWAPKEPSTSASHNASSAPTIGRASPPTKRAATASAPAAAAAVVSPRGAPSGPAVVPAKATTVSPSPSAVPKGVTASYSALASSDASIELVSPRPVSTPPASSSAATAQQVPVSPRYLRTSPGTGSRSGTANAEEEAKSPRMGVQRRPDSTSVAAADKDKLLEQLQLKCKWLEAELYRSDEVMLTLHIIQAESLLAVDPNGLSDPFCVVDNVITTSGDKLETRVVRETLDPQWNQSFTFQMPTSDWSFRIDIYDWSPDKAPQKLGYCELRSEKWALKGPKQMRRWLPILDGSGTLYCGLQVRKERASGSEKVVFLRSAL